MTTVVIVDDHRAFGERLRAFIRDQLRCTVVGIGADARTGLELLQTLRPDVALIDVGLPGESGFDLARRLASELPNVRVVLMGDEESVEYMRAAAEAGAIAYLSKTAVSQSLPALLGATGAGVTLESTSRLRPVVSSRSRRLFGGAFAIAVLVSGLAVSHLGVAVAGAFCIFLLLNWWPVQYRGRRVPLGTRRQWPLDRDRRGEVAPVMLIGTERPGKEGEDLG